MWHKNKIFFLNGLYIFFAFWKTVRLLLLGVLGNVEGFSSLRYLKCSRYCILIYLLMSIFKSGLCLITNVISQDVHCFVVAAVFRHWWQRADTFWDGHYLVFWGQALQSDHGLHAWEIGHHGTEGAVWANAVRGKCLQGTKRLSAGICFGNNKWNSMCLM